MQVGSYFITKSSECFRIFPENKKGETIPLTISRRFIILRHSSGTEITFKHYLWRGRLLWSDSRLKGSCGTDHVLTEVARMLFQGNVEKAGEFIA